LAKEEVRKKFIRCIWQKLL